MLVVLGNQLCGIVYANDVVPFAIHPLVYFELPSISNLILCLNVELDGVIVDVNEEPVFTLDGIDNAEERGIVPKVTDLEAVKSDTYVPP